jgi:apolipoprotein D and lipocalin family protein
VKFNFLWIGLVLCLSGCVSVPDGITPVQNFDRARYLGRWYEVARLDHSFERGLEQVTATYSVREDGSIKVLNQGFDTEDQDWSDAEGYAYFVEGEDQGYLKVSFFRPFYGAYVVFDLDQKGYQHAYVTSSNRDYLWFLSRTPTVSQAAKQRFIQKAKAKGFDTDALIWVPQKKR